MTKKEEETELEQKLLNKTSIDELIKIKMEEELAEEYKKANSPQKKEIITDISKVPSKLIFSKQSVFKIFNRISKTETYINGVQAEGLLGLQNSVREKILAGRSDSFSTEKTYVKFEKIEC